jgi:hypothetical protein
MNTHFFCGVTAFVLVLRLAAPVSSQLAAQDKEISLEESYLQTSVVAQIIREQARSSDRDSKLLALDSIKDVLDKGGNAVELVPILEELTNEGILNKTREDGRIVDNFPDVRMKAVEYLGDIGAKATNDADKLKISEILTKSVNVEREPAVMTEAVRSIVKVGIDCYSPESKGHTLAVVNHNFIYLNVKQPDNRFALAYTEAIAEIAPKLSTGSGATQEERIAYQNSIENLRRISENNSYTTPVRTRAKTILTDLQKKAISGR